MSDRTVSRLERPAGDAVIDDRRAPSPQPPSVVCKLETTEYDGSGDNKSQDHGAAHRQLAAGNE